MKHEWKKHERELYGVGEKPLIITIPEQKYITIEGKGNPNHEDFSERVAVLYSLAYPLKMRFKAMCSKEKDQCSGYEYDDYAVYPLEGVWSSTNADDPLDKDSFIYTLMIRQPDYITREMFETAFEVVKKKKPNPLLNEIAFGSIEDGKSIQMLHSGSFDDEPASFTRMDQFANENGLSRISHFHREIYLGDARKIKPEKRKTILRFQV